MSGAEAVRAALARAQAFRAAACAFALPADAAAIACELGAWSERSSGVLSQALSRARRALAEAGEGLADEQERLLGGRGGAVPCRETAYADARRIAPTDLADLVGFLRAFGLAATQAPPDHVCTEFELASVLALKEAWALAEGWSERAAIARGAYQRLLADHLACWIPAFAARVRDAAEDAFHIAAADALECLVRGEAEAHGVAVPEAGASAPAAEGPPIACGC